MAPPARPAAGAASASAQAAVNANPGMCLKDTIDGPMPFELVSDFKPAGDQPAAIAALAEGVREGAPHQVLLGITGSGKTFTVASVIERVDRPCLVISPNKTLAAQLFAELKAFFPRNAVGYFVSYYDYYQPEA